MTSGMRNATLSFASNLNFKYIYYNNDAVLQFLIDNYGENSDEFHTFNNIIPFAYKIDFWRLALLYKIGGYYSDVDSVLLKKELNSLIENNATMILPVGYATEFVWFGFDFAFIGSVPQHPLLRIAMDMIIYNVKNKFIPQVPQRLNEIWFFKYFTITGPVLMGKAFNRFMNEPDEAPHNIVKGRSLGIQFLGFCEVNGRKYFTTIPHQRNIRECRGETVIQFAYDEYWEERWKTSKPYWRNVIEGKIFNS
ncbi:predicted protein [Naegleria gruberi]|uniref:Predicted protein n=1 Tax=Naegleria gruberi TaxID=5762 RepID=D2VD32_NAEGR|nr:uncharacterized protein NAEGRDRAFT_66891 [Naegleria gruberi]EFC45165.1 predicted protein [Naegleria gruberi]|eukprot:XP_002677909.1 predicted protein [Naegleria gruberi strain NEG-M]